jgi:hypothetical protein
VTVFPLPVNAIPIMSRPLKITGIPWTYRGGNDGCEKKERKKTWLEIEKERVFESLQGWKRKETKKKMMMMMK